MSLASSLSLSLQKEHIQHQNRCTESLLTARTWHRQPRLAVGRRLSSAAWRVLPLAEAPLGDGVADRPPASLWLAHAEREPRQRTKVGDHVLSSRQVRDGCGVVVVDAGRVLNLHLIWLLKVDAARLHGAHKLLQLYRGEGRPFRGQTGRGVRAVSLPTACTALTNCCN